MKQKVVSRSRYVTNMAAGSIVTSYTGVKAACGVVELIQVKPTKPLIEELTKAVELARVKFHQREMNEGRVGHYVKLIDSIPPQLENFDMKLVVTPDGELEGVDGASKLEALRRTFERSRNMGLSLEIRKAESEEALKDYVASLDPRGSERTGANLIRLEYGPQAEEMSAHIKSVNTTIAHIRNGCPNRDMRRVKECDPSFQTAAGRCGKHMGATKSNVVLSPENLRYCHMNEEETLQFVHAHFPMKSKKEKSGLLQKAGVMTAVVLSYKVYGPTVWNVWQHFFEGCFLQGAGHGPLNALWVDLVTSKASYGGRAQLALFHRAVHAFLTAWNFPRDRMETEYVDGARYQIVKGEVSRPMVKVTRHYKPRAKKA